MGRGKFYISRMSQSGDSRRALQHATLADDYLLTFSSVHSFSIVVDLVIVHLIKHGE